MTELREPLTGRAPAAGGARVMAEFEDAQSAGGWMVVSGILLALVWWVGLAACVFGLIGLPALSAVPPELIIGASVAAAVPGFLMIMAGYMARANRRASLANAVVMSAAARLLSPAETMGQEGAVMADQLKQSALEMDQVMQRAVATMKTMSGDIGDERMRLESVSYASADNARDLAERLSAERQSLETLARDLRGQISVMNESLPQQARVLAETARKAVQEVTRADEALDGRLEKMRGAGDHLATKMMDLDALARDAATRTETLTLAVSRIEDKLDQSRKTVDAAIRAGDMAAAAASSTGDALKDAVSSALDTARHINSEINVSTRSAAEDAARSLAELRAAGDAAAASVRAAGAAARGEMSELDPVTHVAPNDTPRPIAAPESAPVNHTSIDDMADTQTETAPPEIALQTPSVSDAELFDAGADAMAASGEDAPLELGRTADPADGAPFVLRSRLGEEAAPTPQPDSVAVPPPVINTPPAAHPVNAASNGDMGWRDILSDIDRADSPDLSREEVADALLHRLQDSGIRLPEIFKPKAKRKIAAAATRGDDARRNATKDMVGQQVERVFKRMRADRELKNLARQFHAMEEADALNALSQTQKTSRNASARLAAYLLIDAAGV